jgi:hypothetical protein
MSVTTHASAPSLAAPPPAASVDFPLPWVTTFETVRESYRAQCLQTQLQGVTCSSWETHE